MASRIDAVNGLMHSCVSVSENRTAVWTGLVRDYCEKKCCQPSPVSRASHKHTLHSRSNLAELIKIRRLWRFFPKGSNGLAEHVVKSRHVGSKVDRPAKYRADKSGKRFLHEKQEMQKCQDMSVSKNIVIVVSEPELYRLLIRLLGPEMARVIIRIRMNEIVIYFRQCPPDCRRRRQSLGTEGLAGIGFLIGAPVLAAARPNLRVFRIIDPFSDDQDGLDAGS